MLNTLYYHSFRWHRSLLTFVCGKKFEYL